MDYNCMEAQCLGKTPYVSKPEAIGRIRCQVKNRKRQTRGDHSTLHPYHCPWCHLWHVGTTRKK